MENERQGIEDGPKAEIHLDSLKEIGNHKSTMEYMDSGLKDSLLSITDQHSNLTNAHERQEYLNTWQKRILSWLRKPKKGKKC